MDCQNCYSCQDKEGTVWNVVAFDDSGKEIQPGFEERFLEHLNDPIPRCKEQEKQ